jgi:hypothetical protein
MIFCFAGVSVYNFRELARCLWFCSCGIEVIKEFNL